MFECGPPDYQIYILNDSGSDYNYGDLILDSGLFGNVTDKNGIADGERGYIDGTPFREIETDQIDTGTFAIDAFIYSEGNADLLRETKTANTWRVAVVTRAKGSNATIKIKTLIPQRDTT